MCDADNIMPQLKPLFDQLQGFKIPPLECWHPRKSMDIGLRIAADGRWYHQGAVIGRRRLVKLFCSVLRLEENGRYYLVTPGVKYPVAVDDAPFHAVELNRQGAGRAQNLIFRTNADDVVLADRAHPIRVKTNPASGHPSPHIEVRDGLQAKISRAVYYELAQLLEPAQSADGDDESGDAEDEKLFGVYSGGQFFPFGRA